MKFHDKLWEMVKNRTAFSIEHNGVRHTYVHKGIYAGLWRYRKQTKRCTYQPIKILAEKEKALVVGHKANTKRKLKASAPPIAAADCLATLLQERLSDEQREVLPMPVLFYAIYSGGGSAKKAYIVARQQVVGAIANWKKFCALNGISGELSVVTSSKWEDIYSATGDLPVEIPYTMSAWLKKHPPAWRARFIQTLSEVGIKSALKKHTRLPDSLIEEVAQTDPVTDMRGRSRGRLLLLKGFELNHILGYDFNLKIVPGAKRETD